MTNSTGYRVLICALFLLSLPLNKAFAQTPFSTCAYELKNNFNIYSTGWSRELEQKRIYSQEESGLTAGDLNDLEVLWAFGFKDTDQPRSLPAITAEAVFIGSQEGTVFALSTANGCGFWSTRTSAAIRGAITIAELDRLDGHKQWTIFAANDDANVYALDAVTGRILWERKVEEHENAVITGSPVFYNDRLYIPISSKEVGKAVNPWSDCCTFRGSLVSLDAATGKELWKTHTIKTKAGLRSRNILGGRQYGPSGAAIWSAPTIDVKRQLIYIGTGQNYSLPVTQYSNAIIALDIHNGSIVWAKKLWPNDAWNVACPLPIIGVNCPLADAKDFDFGAPPILLTSVNGKDRILAGSKSGIVYALDPENNGAILWEKAVGKGGLLGGIHWGMAADSASLYIPVSDLDPPFSRTHPTNLNKPGLNKLDVSDGSIIWHSSADEPCSGKKECRVSFSAAVTGIPGAILAPGINGVLYAFSRDNGQIIWQFDSTKEVLGVNGIRARGGAMDAGGVVVANGMLFFNSGYAGPASSFGRGGNIFWVLGKRTTHPVRPHN